jgi:hypothetical protein
MPRNRYPGFGPEDARAFARGAVKPPPRNVEGVPLTAVLSRYANTVNLPANPSQTTPIDPAEYVDGIEAEAEAAWPRIINIYSLLTGTPPRTSAFDARISWTGGGGSTRFLYATGAGGGLQIAVRCKALNIRLANWLNNTHVVQIAVEDGEGNTQELHRAEREQALASGANQEFPIPPYAREVWVASDKAPQAPNILVSQVDDGPVLVASFSADTGWVPVGMASKLRVTNNDPAALANYTAIFRLGYQG